MSSENQIELYETSDPFADVFRQNRGAFKTGLLDVEIVPQSMEEEERITACQDHVIASGCFERTRIPFRPMLRKILEGIFDELHIGKRNGVDIGSGMTGEMVHQLLPLTEEERATWTECEINPGSAEALRQRYPDSKIIRGSYLRLRESLGRTEGIDTISGLSSLDATNHLEEAIKEIRESLSVGGFLVHMQDVRPGVNHPINVLNSAGYRRPYQCVIGVDGPPLLPGMVPNPHGYIIQGEAISSAELFRQALGETVKNTKGLRLLFNRWVYAVCPLENDDEFSAFLMDMVAVRRRFDKAKTAHAVITVAQRI
jgi:hypothetical protein